MQKNTAARLAYLAWEHAAQCSDEENERRQKNGRQPNARQLSEKQLAEIQIARMKQQN